MEATIKIEDGQTHSVKLDPESAQLLQELSNERLTDGMLTDYIRNLDVSADAKLMLTKISQQAIKIGDKIYNIGKKILEVVFMVAHAYPHTLFGLILGVIISALVSSIPILGILFGPLVGPIAIVFGLAAGYANDLRDKKLKQTVTDTVSMFSALKEHEL